MLYSVPWVQNCKLLTQQEYNGRLGMDNTQVTVSHGASLKLARVVLMDDRGAAVWDGTLRQFFRDNHMTGADAKLVVEQLRPRGHLMEPAFVKMGGGAGVDFMLCLLESKDDRVRARRRCRHGQWSLSCEMCADARATHFDYDLQVWVRDAKAVRCGHPESMQCSCVGRRFEGMHIEDVRIAFAKERA